MTWEETIISIREKEEFKDLVQKAYLDEDIELNVTRFGKSEEFNETLKIIKQYQPNAKMILDIGCGNGITAINFALKDYHVVAVEPDSSITVGAGAIRKLKVKHKLDNLDIYELFAEDIDFKTNYFDVVYMRQAMHHANNLEKFVKECIRVLKPDGLLLTVRDHVIYNEKDKSWFLETHPLHKYYGGENAYLSKQYKNAIGKAGAKVINEIKYYDSIINYFPMSTKMIDDLKKMNETYMKKRLVNKLGVIVQNNLIWNLYRWLTNYKPLNEALIPGRMYSYIALKL